MKLAYLILVHNAPHHLSRLINRLDGPNVVFLIHIDKKSDIGPFINAVKKADNIHFIKNRINIYWRGYSIVKATLELMKAAQKYHANYNILLSGSDYPIKSNRYIHNFLGKSELEYISFFRFSDRPAWMKKVEQYHYLDSRLTNPFGYHKTAWRYRWLQMKSAQLLPKRKFIKNMIPYGGSEWWMITDRCVKYILEFIENNKHFVNFFKYTDAPDELVFQTIIMNSSFARNVINWEHYQNKIEREKLHATWPCPASVYNYRYIDWSRERSNGPGHPVVLDERDFEALIASHCLFARKFDPIRSKVVLDLIDSYIDKENRLLNNIPDIMDTQPDILRTTLEQ